MPIDLVKDKHATMATALGLCVAIVNDRGGFGSWAFVDVADPYDDVVKLI